MRDTATSTAAAAVMLGLVRGEATWRIWAESGIWQVCYAYKK